MMSTGTAAAAALSLFISNEARADIGTYGEIRDMPGMQTTSPEDESQEDKDEQTDETPMDSENPKNDGDVIHDNDAEPDEPEPEGVPTARNREPRIRFNAGSSLYENRLSLALNADFKFTAGDIALGIFGSAKYQKEFQTDNSELQKTDQNYAEVGTSIGTWISDDITLSTILGLRYTDTNGKKELMDDLGALIGFELSSEELNLNFHYTRSLENMDFSNTFGNTELETVRLHGYGDIELRKISEGEKGSIGMIIDAYYEQLWAHDEHRYIIDIAAGPRWKSQDGNITVGLLGTFRYGEIKNELGEFMNRFGKYEEEKYSLGGLAQCNIRIDDSKWYVMLRAGGNNNGDLYGLVSIEYTFGQPTATRPEQIMPTEIKRSQGTPTIGGDEGGSGGVQ
jgi:hypothetical protein